MFLRIEQLLEKSLIGMRILTTVNENRSFELWSKFMPRRNEIKNKTGNVYYSIQVYDSGMDISRFTPETFFEKWAAVEVDPSDQVPPQMETFKIPSGLYAVFLHRGRPSTFIHTWRFIFDQWLPESEYQLNQGPHFEVLGEKYKRDDPDSEEEVWIPIKLRM